MSETTDFVEVAWRDRPEERFRADARVTNLEVTLSKLAHGERHRTRNLDRRRHGENNPSIMCACGCERTFPKFDGSGRPRRFLSGHNAAVQNREGVMGSRG